MPDGNGTGIKFVVRRYDDSTVYVPLRYAAAGSSNRARKLTLSVGQIATVSVFSGGDTAGKGYLDGAPVTATVTSGIGGWTYGYRTSGKSFVGGNPVNGSKRAFYGEVLSVRCYNRYITDEEVAFNRAADKRRFNLP